ncbi:MAG: ATP-binding protein [Terriglobales bacterium]
MLSAGAAAAIVLACVALRHVHATTVVLILLLTILIVASRWGFGEAAAATVMGSLLLNYFFLPPAGWRVKSAEHWLDFLSFLIVALVTSSATARIRRHTVEALARHRELERLNAFGRDLPIDGDPGSIVETCLQLLVRVFQVEAAAFYDQSDGSITGAGPKQGAAPGDLLRDTAGHSDIYSEGATGWVLSPIRSLGQPVGSLGVCGGSMSRLTFKTVAERIEARLEEVRAHEKLAQARNAKKSQELKSAVLDSLVHEIKTPLSVIKTAVTSLLSRDLDASSHDELLAIINEETDRMDVSISEVFWTARAEAGTLQPESCSNDLRELLSQTLDELKPLISGRTVSIEAPDPLPSVHCDFHMIKRVLKELLNNAVKYSPPRSPLAISMRVSGENVVTSVADWGMGIQPGEEKHVFEKYHRGPVGAPGTGLGLAIAKTIVEAHGGQIAADVARKTGATFCFSLPISEQDAA